MRVTGGQFSGRHLQIPKGPPIRPTLEHVRQAIFNLLGERVRGARVLDLFSGTGALGIEALSRRAAHVTFVDRSYFCVRAIEENLKTLSLTTLESPPFAIHRAEVLTGIRKLAREGALFDLVLLDPPYGHGLVRKSLNALTQYAMVAPLGLVVVEQDKRDSLPPQVEGKGIRQVLQRRQRYGDTVVAFYERQDDPAPPEFMPSARRG
ncbi:MAG: 16S rRNA (guanine(966)-N(2))-methyltransferase RsmD [Candidatus Omnitrophica bacterium]|nr:16S rRNA (guanine(966)-N(2))-methyltransferase RsmD [Candidatus Omnitrophota bacterium]